MAKVLDDGTWSGGKIRDVSNEMLQLKAEHKPYLVRVRKGRRVFNSTPEWPVEDEPAVDLTGVGDGQAPGDSDFNSFESLKDMLQGRAMQKWRPIAVGKRAQLLTNQYGGIKDLFAKNGVTALRALGRDIEAICMGTQDSLRTTVSSRPVDQTRGWFRWLSCGADPDELTIPTMAKAPSGNRVSNRTSAAAILESDVRGVMKSICDATKQASGDYMLYCTTAFKAVFSDYAFSNTLASGVTTGRYFQQPAQNGAMTLSLNVTTYNGDFGKLTLHPHFDLPAATGDYTDTYNATSGAASVKRAAGYLAATQVFGYLINHDFCEMNMIQAPQIERLPSDGGGPRANVDAIFINCVLNPRAHGAFYSITD